MSLSPQELEALLGAKRSIDAQRALRARPVAVPVPSNLPPLAVPTSSPRIEPAGPGFGLGAEPQAPQAPVEQLVTPPVVQPPKPPAAPRSDLEDFASFSGQAPRRAPLPRGAKNVKCHTIERDPDSGKISKVYTYDMEEDSTNGDQVSRQSEEQPS